MKNLLRTFISHAILTQSYSGSAQPINWKQPAGNSTHIAHVFTGWYSGTIMGFGCSAAAVPFYLRLGYYRFPDNIRAMH